MIANDETARASEPPPPDLVVLCALRALCGEFPLQVVAIRESPTKKTAPRIPDSP